jgi:hypothetical protein
MYGDLKNITKTEDPARFWYAAVPHPRRIEVPLRRHQEQA